MNWYNKEPKYARGKIYMITSKHTTDIYIGYTIKSLSNVLSKFKNYYNKTNKSKSILYNIIKHGDCMIKLLEYFPCENRKQLLMKKTSIKKKLK